MRDRSIDGFAQRSQLVRQPFAAVNYARRSVRGCARARSDSEIFGIPSFSCGISSGVRRLIRALNQLEWSELFSAEECFALRGFACEDNADVFSNAPECGVGKAGFGAFRASRKSGNRFESGNRRLGRASISGSGGRSSDALLPDEETLSCQRMCGMYRGPKRTKGAPPAPLARESYRSNKTEVLLSRRELRENSSFS